MFTLNYSRISRKLPSDQDKFHKLVGRTSRLHTVYFWANTYATPKSIGDGVDLVKRTYCKQAPQNDGQMTNSKPITGV